MIACKWQAGAKVPFSEVSGGSLRITASISIFWKQAISFGVTYPHKPLIIQVIACTFLPSRLALFVLVKSRQFHPVGAFLWSNLGFGQGLALASVPLAFAARVRPHFSVGCRKRFLQKIRFGSSVSLRLNWIPRPVRFFFTPRLAWD